MAKFLTQDEAYRVIQRELPEDVYPHSGTPATYWTTSEDASFAQILAGLYAEMKIAYDNQWPQHANAAGIAQHEIARFGELSQGLTLAERQDRVLARMRTRPTMSRPDLRQLVENELTPGTDVRFYNWGQRGGLLGADVYLKWFLGLSQLGFDTYLGGGTRWPYGVDICQQTPESGGLTSEQLVIMRQNAYTYVVQIIGYTPTTAELAAIERVLNASEKASVQHVIDVNPDPSTDPTHQFDATASYFYPIIEAP